MLDERQSVASRRREVPGTFLSKPPSLAGHSPQYAAAAPAYAHSPAPTHAPTAASATPSSTLETSKDVNNAEAIPFPLDEVTETNVSPWDIRDGQVNLFTGAYEHRLDFPLPTARSAAGTPNLALTYRSDRPGHEARSPFGEGWDVEVPRIRVRMWPEVPNYEQPEYEFVHAGLLPDARESVLELQPAKRAGDAWVDDSFPVGDYVVRRYVLAYQQPVVRIERWEHQPTKLVHWRMTNAENVTSLFGSVDTARVTQPEKPHQTAIWNLYETYDDAGEVVQYVYAQRATPIGLSSVLSRVRYANTQPFSRDRWHYEVCFEYRDSSEGARHPDETSDLAHSTERSDVTINRRYGFPLVSAYLCRRVALFHRFGELGDDPVLVRYFHLRYDESPTVSKLSSITPVGVITERMPPVEEARPALTFSYLDESVQEAQSFLTDAMLAPVLADETREARWVRDASNGLPGLLFRDGATVLHIENRGEGHFLEPKVREGESLGSEEWGEVLDLTVSTDSEEMHATIGPGAISSTMIGGAETPQGKEVLVAHVDFNGDGREDVVVADEHSFRWYPSLGDEGFGDPVVLHLEPTASDAPRKLRSEARQSFHLADVTGDGLLDLVRIRPNGVQYWPAYGDGSFADPIELELPIGDGTSEASAKDNPTWDPSRVLVAKLNGTGAVDFVEVCEGHLLTYANQGGRALAKAQRIEAPDLTTSSPRVSACDLFGVGRDVVVWVETGSRGARVRYLATKGTGPQGVLQTLSNGMGGEVALEWVTFAKLLHDADDLTDLSMSEAEHRRAGVAPGQALVTKIARDQTLQTEDVWSYRFAEPYGENASSRMVGFARTDVWNAQLRETYWHHVGISLEASIGKAETAKAPSFRKALSTSWWPFENVEALSKVEPIQDVVSTRDVVALRGCLLRKETYDLAQSNVEFVGETRSDFPLSVEEHGYEVVRLWQSEQEASGISVLVRRESLSVELALSSVGAAGNQRDASDLASARAEARLVHYLVLGRDEIGDPIDEVELIYPPEASDPATYPQTALRRVQSRRLAHLRSPTWFRARVPVEWECASGELPGDAWQTEASLRDVVSRTAWTREAAYRWWYTAEDTDQSEEKATASRSRAARRDEWIAPLGLLESLEATRHVGFDATLREVLTDQMGLRLESDGIWRIGWTVTYDHRAFSLPVRWVGATGDWVGVKRDATSMSVREVRTHAGSRWRFRWHARAAAYSASASPQGLTTAVRFTANGEWLSWAQSWGKGLGDGLDGDSREAAADDDPTAIVVWSFPEGGPAGCEIRYRETHGDPETALRVVRIRLTGFGAVGQIETQASNGTWRVLTQRVAENGRATEFAPIAHREDATQATTAMWQSNPGTLRFLAANGARQAVRTTPWQVGYWDEVDLLPQSAWAAEAKAMAQRSEAVIAAGMSRYLSGAARQARTPTVLSCDAWGRPQMLTWLNENAETFALAITCRPGVWEWRIGENVWQREGDAAGAIAIETHPSGASDVVLRRPDGEWLWRWQTDGLVAKRTFDEFGRVLQTWVRRGTEDWQLEEWRLWSLGSERPSAHLLARLTPYVTELFDGFRADGTAALTGIVPQGLRSGVTPENLSQRVREASQKSHVMWSRDAFGRLNRGRFSYGVRGEATEIEVQLEYGAEGVLHGCDVTGPDGIAEPLLRGTKVGEQATQRMFRALSSAMISSEELGLTSLRSLSAGNSAVGDSGRTTSRFEARRDPAGRPIFVLADGALRSSVTYDERGLPALAERREQMEEGVMVDLVTQYTRDVFGNVIRRGERMAETTREVAYERASWGPLTGLSDHTGSVALEVVTDGRGQVLQLGEEVVAGWDVFGRLIRAVQPASGVEAVYAYDAAGQLIYEGMRVQDDWVSHAVWNQGFVGVWYQTEDGAWAHSSLYSLCVAEGVHVAAISSDAAPLDTLVALTDQLEQVSVVRGDQGAETHLVHQRYDLSTGAENALLWERFGRSGMVLGLGGLLQCREGVWSMPQLELPLSRPQGPLALWQSVTEAFWERGIDEVGRDAWQAERRLAEDVLAGPRVRGDFLGSGDPLGDVVFGSLHPLWGFRIPHAISARVEV